MLLLFMALYGIKEVKMELIKLTDEERNTVMAHHEASKALVELVNRSVSNMDRRTLETCLDEVLPLVRESLLSSWDILDELKKKYKLADIIYCAQNGEVYGRV